MPAENRPISDRRALFSRLEEYSRYSREMHRRHAPFPHWYLLVIGVADRYRGRGYAGRLLRPVFEHLDRQGLPCYLETHNPANLGFYEHYGFKVIEEGRLPGTDRPHWAMLRARTSRVVAGPAKLTE
ncbi:MAG: GNAT family N-acetyltransferase [Bacillota bacterium]